MWGSVYCFDDNTVVTCLQKHHDSEYICPVLVLPNDRASRKARVEERDWLATKYRDAFGHDFRNSYGWRQAALAAAKGE